MLIFIQGGNSNVERIENFHSNYQYIWLWAPDEIVESMSKFLKLLVKNSSAGKDQSQQPVKQAYVNCLISMRKDMGWKETELKFQDYEFVNIRQRP